MRATGKTCDWPAVVSGSRFRVPRGRVTPRHSAPHVRVAHTPSNDGRHRFRPSRRRPRGARRRPQGHRRAHRARRQGACASDRDRATHPRPPARGGARASIRPDVARGTSARLARARLPRDGPSRLRASATAADASSLFFRHAPPDSRVSRCRSRSRENTLHVSHSRLDSRFHTRSPRASPCASPPPRAMSASA